MKRELLFGLLACLLLVSVVHAQQNAGDIGWTGTRDTYATGRRINFPFGAWTYNFAHSAPKGAPPPIPMMLAQDEIGRRRSIEESINENFKIRAERKNSSNPFGRGIVSAFENVSLSSGADVDAMISKLKDLKVNCYTYLIQFRSESDLAVLPEFCEKAAKEGIEVWAYLIPPSETDLTELKKPIAERKYPPFDMDYVKWAEALAKISLEHPNLTLWIIDDFDGNTQFFTLDYTKRIFETSKKINPKLLFGVCVYYPSMKEFAEDGYLSCIDAVLWGYQANFRTFPDAGISARTLPLEINDYHKIYSNKVIIPCIYFTAHSSWPEGRPTKEYLEEALKISYEQAGICWIFTTPQTSTWKYDVVKNYVNSIKLTEWSNKK